MSVFCPFIMTGLNNTTHWIRFNTFRETKLQPLSNLRVPGVILYPRSVCELMRHKKKIIIIILLSLFARTSPRVNPN